MIPNRSDAGTPPASAPVRVLFLIDVLHVVGGTEKQLRELISRMDRSRFTPTLVAVYSMHMPHEAEFGGMGCPVRCLGLRRLVSAKGIRAVLQLAAEIRRERIHLIQTFFPDASIVGTIAGRLGGARVVLGRRDLGYWYTPRYLSVLRVLQRFAHAYLVNSQAVRTAVSESERVDPDRVQVVYNGFFDLPTGPSRLTLADFGFPLDAKLVGIVANLRQIKRLDRFVEMAASIRDPRARFLIVGYGELQDALLAQARRAGLGERLRITRTLQDVLEVIKLFRVGALTSESEGLSNTLVEFGLCGVPAVAFDVGGNREVIEDGVSGFLVKPFDVPVLTKRVEELLADDALRSRLGTGAKALCTDRFGGARMVEQTQAFYERLVGRAR
jgi:glycosyltransferase involved in cell wall biosynthesis